MKNKMNIAIFVAITVLFILLMLKVVDKLFGEEADLISYYISMVTPLLLLIWLIRQRWKSQSYLRFCISATISYIIFMFLFCPLRIGGTSVLNPSPSIIGMIIFAPAMIIFGLLYPLITIQCALKLELIEISITSFIFYSFVIWGIISLFAKRKQPDKKIADKPSEDGDSNIEPPASKGITENEN